MEIESHLTPNETLLLQTGPNVPAHLFLSIIGMILLFVLGFAALSGSGTESATCTINGQSYSGEECSGITNIIGYVLLVAGILVPLINYWMIRITQYAVTSERIIIQSGLIGRDVRSINPAQIRSVFVNVGIIGKIFGLGTINIDTGMVTYNKSGNSQVQYEKLSLVSEPYKVLQVIQANLLARPK